MKEKLSTSLQWTFYPDMTFKDIHLLPSHDDLRLDILQRLTTEDFTLFSEIDMEDTEDIIFWKRTSSGIFKTADAWEFVRQKNPLQSLRSHIWSSRIPLKISAFMWRLLHSFIPTHDILKRQKISLASKCVFCDSEETLHHLFVSCSFATDIWRFFEHLLCVFPKHSHSINSKLESWWIMRFSQPDHEVLSLLSCLITWDIWKARNSCIHEGKKIPSAKICDRILLSIRTISEAKPFSGISASLKRLLHLDEKQAKPHSCIPISWLLPPMDRVKLNVDGSSLGNPGASGGGGLIRNYQGSPLFGFSCFYGTMSSIQAECNALHDGISLCLQHGFVQVDVEMDSLFLEQMINGSKRVAWQLDHLIRQISKSTSGLNFSYKHIYREANSVANSLATEASSTGKTYFFNSSCIPFSIKGVIALDAIQYPYIRHK